ncbi:hypothetical protein EPH_0075340 [Eimeria praecox]|uniref:Uncharacterized protein n=1 Tax=Eimeria praecox TaxID=51316 RepID=U6H3K3_9EIME|nr:hypothetical protein EPH_0075340 [Eimeria praecox]
MSTVQEETRFNRTSAPQPTAVTNPVARELPHIAAPKKPVVEMQPQEHQSDEIARLRQQVERLQNCLIQMSVQRLSFVPPLPLAREKGNNMQPFLMLIDLKQSERPTAAQAPASNGEEKRNADNSRDVNVGVSVEDRQSVTNVELPPWWRELVANEGSKMEGMLCNVGAPAVLPVEVVGRSCEALLDTGASRSFINPRWVEALQMKVWKLSDVCMFTIVNSAQLRIDRTVKRLTVWCGRECFTGDYLVGSVPYDIVLGLDWFMRHKVSWCFQSDKLRTYLDGRWCELPLVRTHMAKRTEYDNQVAPKRTPPEQAYDLLPRQVAQMTEEEAAALLRSPPTRTKQRTKPVKEVPIKALIEQARANTAGLRSPLQGLNMVLALPEVDVSVALRIPEEQQGALCCAIISHANTQAEEALPTPAVDIPHATDDEDSP